MELLVSLASVNKYFLMLNKISKKISSNLIHYSDKPGNHDFKILKKLVLPDGSVLRARYAGRPTRDCLFEDPVMDGKRQVEMSLYVPKYCQNFFISSHSSLNSHIIIHSFAVC